MRSLQVACLVAALGAPAALAQEQFYVMTGNIFPQIHEINPANGSIISSVSVTGQESLFGGLAVDGDGTLWSIDGYNDANPDRLFKIDRLTGAGSVVGPTGENWNFRTMCLNPQDGTLYAATDNRLYKMDTNTGGASFIADIVSPLGHLDQLTALAINAQGQAYISDIGDVSFFSLDLSTGIATHIGDIRPGAGAEWFEDLAFDSSGVLWGAHFNFGGMYTIEVGSATETFKFASGATGLAFVGGGAECYPDCDGDEVLTLADFGCFQTKFALGDLYADCNGDLVLNLADFGCFQTQFALGCP
jgi:hypothetical protein